LIQLQAPPADDELRTKANEEIEFAFKPQIVITLESEGGFTGVGPLLLPDKLNYLWHAARSHLAHVRRTSPRRLQMRWRSHETPALLVLL
jgi:hypothetical protein